MDRKFHIVFNWRTQPLFNNLGDLPLGCRRTRVADLELRLEFWIQRELLLGIGRRFWSDSDHFPQWNMFIAPFYRGDLDSWGLHESRFYDVGRD